LWPILNSKSTKQWLHIAIAAQIFELQIATIFEFFSSAIDAPHFLQTFVK